MSLTQEYKQEAQKIAKYWPRLAQTVSTKQAQAQETHLP